MFLPQPASAGDAPEQAAFAHLLEAGPHRGIPWETHVNAVGLTNFQRILVQVDLEVPARQLVKRSDQNNLIGAVRFTDAAGHIYQDSDAMQLTSGSVEGLKGNGHLTWDVFALPGDYHVGLALLDRTSGEYSVMFRRLHVQALKKDPLPDVWHDLPAIEFIDNDEKIDGFFHPKVQGRLHLPLETRQPVQIELLMNLTPSEIFKGSERVNRINLDALLPILKTFTQIDIRNGSLNIAVLNGAGERPSFTQENVQAGTLDWPRLKDAIAAAEPAKVGVGELENRKQSAAFFREVVEGVIRARSHDEATKPHVFILVSSPMFFDFRHALRPIELHGECNCLVYHLLYDWAPQDQMFDDVMKVLKPLKPHTLSVFSPKDLRKALASILAEISKL